MSKIFKQLLLGGILFALSSCQSTSQEPVRIDFDNENGKPDYYMELRPAEDNIKGVLVLMPGFSQRAEDVFADSDLPMLAVANNLLVVTIGTGFNLCTNDTVASRLTQILTDVLIKHEFGQEQFAFGGFSAGGSILLRYAERCLETPGDHPVVPAAVFTIDSPVDVISFFDYCDREVARDYSDVGIKEAIYIKKMLENKYGTLAENRAVYEQLTSVDVSSDVSGNEQYLYRTPVRVYHEIDISWLIKERRRSARDANFIQSSELINRLVLLGNNRAEFMQSNIKGQRKDGRRHPHSWNIVDGPECMEWINNSLGL